MTMMSMGSSPFPRRGASAACHGSADGTPAAVAELEVVGGEQRSPRSLLDGQQNWHGYVRGLVVGVDTETGATTRRLEYATPPSLNAGPDAAISFQAASREGDRLYLCTETEVLVYRLPGFELLHHVSIPWFNDVHHVRPTPAGDLLVASAGLELVIEVTVDGEVRRVWNVLGEDPWARFDPSVDYRKVASTKPHRGHPNFIFMIGEDVWATRFHQGDAICLTRPRDPIAISNERIHDGVLHDGLLYFTTVDGSIVVVDAESLEKVEVLDLNRFHGDRTAVLGWCRGVLADGDRLWVGFSRIRPTRFRENVAWLTRGFRQGLPTHLACYDVAARTCEKELDLEAAGISAIYSIFPAAQLSSGAAAMRLDGEPDVTSPRG
jgi:hypothetical protein